MAVPRPGGALLGTALATLPGALDGWLASNDANNAAHPAPGEAPDSPFLSQASIFKGILLGLGGIAMAATRDGRAFPTIGTALTARQVAFHYARRDAGPPAQG